MSLQIYWLAMPDPHFVGLLQLEPDPTDKTEQMLVVVSESFPFFDTHGMEWTADKGAVTDGASIPGLLKPIIGKSFQTPYLPAAVLHDIYCKNKSRSWRQTDSMFYEAMITNGVNILKAATMWAAVYVFGPHW